jgi:hypothetical protein
MTRLRPDGDDDDGLSLVELVVVTMLLGMISVLVTGFAINTWRDTSTVTTRTSELDQIQLAFSSASKSLRTAVAPSALQQGCSTCNGAASTDTAISAASSFSVRFYSSTGAAAGPDLVTYTAAWDATRKAAVFTETRQPPDVGSAPNFTYTACTVGAAGCSAKSLPRVVGLEWPAGGATRPALPVLTYYDDSGTLLVGGTDTTNPGALTATQLAKVAAIELRLTVRSKSTSRLGSSTVVNRIYLPNSRLT